MPKFKNSVTGVVVSVSDGTAGRLGVGWEPEKATRKTTSAKSGEDK